MSNLKKLSYAADDFDEIEDEPKSCTQDAKISDVTNDLPNFYVKEKQTVPPPFVEDDPNMYKDPNDSSTRTYDSVCAEDDNENLELLGGEPIEQDVHTLVRNTKKKVFTKDPILRGSMVGMREGVPGHFSGYDRKAKTYSKLERSGSESSVANESSPIRPPRKARGKSDPSVLQNEKDNYDKLWGQKKGDSKDADDSDHIYSVLGSFDESEYDKVEEGNENILSSSPLKDDKWSENRQKMLLSPGIKDRPISTVVLPISPVEGASESDSASDWGSEFDDSIVEYENDDDLYEVVGDMSQKISSNRDSVFDSLTAVRAKTEQALKTKPHLKGKPLPPLPNFPPLPPIPPTSSDNSLNEQDDDSIHYIDVGFDGQSVQAPSLPILNADATEEEVKRYQIIKYILENERSYTISLHKLIQDYERPLKDKRIISQDSVRIIFQHLQEIEQCHHLFDIAIRGRITEWETTPKIGDIIYASFSKSMVLKAYSNYVKNFTKAMETVKDTCRLVPAFLSFLKARLSRSSSSQTFYDLLKKPLGRFPQLVVLLQELLKVTPISHSDRMPLQMALTQLECLSELICEKRRDIEMKYRVSQLDKYFTGLSKPLFSARRYHIRHDDMLLCKVADGQVVKTKLRRLFLLSDLLICASIINKSKAVNKLSKKRYRVKWCVPVAEVDIVDVGSGILVNIDNKTTTIKYTHPVSSPRPGAKKVEEELEALQHDLAVIGQIAGLVATLRKPYDVINEQKCSEWYREVKETCDDETEMANMHWLELALPTKDKKTATYLFKLSQAQLKAEWATELDNTKLRLGYDNNPGWYILEDESESAGNMGILRRNLPLLGNKVPLFMVEAKFTIECILEVTPHGCVKPVLWIFSGNDHTGQITLMEMSMSSIPHVIENFVACGSRILAAEIVKEEPNRFADPLEQKTLVWCGTMSGSIHIYNASSENDHEEVAVARLRDAVLCFKHTQGKVFCGLANGTIACFRKKTDASWDFQNPTVVCLGKSAVMNVTEAGGRLWCACGNFIYIMDITTLGIEHRIDTGDRPPVRHLVSYGSGVWASVWKTPKLHLYHNETFECLQSISVTTPLVRMRKDIDCRIQNINIDKAYITCLQARGGLLWVGTDVGVIVTYPLPRLGGVPHVSGRPCVSFHCHEGPVRCIHAFRVERNFRSRGETEDFDARSLFYVDPFDEAASGLNIPAVIKDSPVVTPSENLSGEPFYFTVVPDGKPATEGHGPRSEYEEWLKSFGRNAKAVDPLLSEARAVPIHADGYNSDESMDSDTEFSFIEDRAKKIPGKAKKNALAFSVDIKPDSQDTGESVGIVKAKNAAGDLPVIAESNFAELMERFEGFTGPNKTETSTTGSISEFVMIEKTNSGYEEPIPAPERVVTVPYAKVNKGKVPNAESGSGAKLLPSFSVEETSAVAKEPNEEDLKKYRDEPLPDVPVKTLYQAAKEWTVGMTLERNGGASDAGKLNLEATDEHTEGECKSCTVEETNIGGAHSSKHEDRASELVTEPGEHEEPNESAERACKQSTTTAIEEICDEQALGGIEVPETSSSSSHMKRASDDPSALGPGEVEEAASNEAGDSTQKLAPAFDNEDDQERNANFGDDDTNKGDLFEGNIKTPLCIKVTDIENQSSIEGSMLADGGFQVERKDSVLSRVEYEEAVPSHIPSVTELHASLPYTPHPRTPAATSQTLPAGVPHAPTNMRTPKNIDLATAKDMEGDTIYTPLLNQTDESSSLSGVGASQFDTEMALSSSLARENQQGHYASLVSVSNRDNHSRRELLMKPMYVVSVGPGYLDIRKKQKLGSGIDFFKNLAASEPEPKLLVWKITS